MTLDIYTILLFVSIALNFVMVVAVFILIFQIGKFKSIGREINKNDRHIKLRIAKKIQEEADAKMDSILREISKKLALDIEAEFKKVDDAALKQLESVSNFTREQQGAIIKESQMMVANLVTKMEEEINAYRGQQMKRIDTSIHEILVDATKEIIGKSMNVSEHEALVEQALERAKKEKFFS